MMKETVTMLRLPESSEETWSTDPFGAKEFATIRKQWPQMLAAFGFMEVCMYANAFSQAFVQKEMGGYYEKQFTNIDGGPVILFDYGFKVLPYMKKGSIADLYVYALLAGSMLRFAVIPGPRSLRWTILRRWVFLFGVLFLIRSFAIFCTPLPNPYTECVPQIKHPNNHFLEAFRIMVYADLTCQDVLYSGHTVMIAICCLMWIYYAPVAPLMRRSRIDWTYRALQVVFVMLMIIGFGIIIATHFHYTVDVFLGACMSAFCFKVYHDAIRIAPFRQDNPLYRVMTWMEKDAVDLVVWHKKAAARIKADEEVEEEIEIEEGKRRTLALNPAALELTANS